MILLSRLLRQNKIIAACIFFISVLGCKDKQEALTWPIDEPDYFSTVTINNKSVECGLFAADYKDSLITMSISYFTDDALYWSQKIGPFLRKNQMITLKPRIAGVSNTYFVYYGSCCVPPVASFPDVVYYTYELWGSDSLNNTMIVEVDTSNKMVVGTYHATVINSVSPFDTISFQCDKFSVMYE